MIRTEYSIEERVAIAELVAFCEILVDDQGKPLSEMHAALGAILMERCANLIRKNSTPYVFSNADVLKFAEFWNVGERAAFNAEPKPKRVQ